MREVKFDGKYHSINVRLLRPASLTLVYGDYDSNVNFSTRVSQCTISSCGERAFVYLCDNSIHGAENDSYSNKLAIKCAHC